MRLAVVGLLVLSSAGCGLLGPDCAERRQSGHVATIQGEAGAGQIVSHRVAYATEGSQNTVAISWPGTPSHDVPGPAIYATRAACTNFTLPARDNAGDCALLASAGRIDGIFHSSMSITHGRGNPEQLGNPPEYILWVVGDPAHATTYALAITWVLPVDC